MKKKLLVLGISSCLSAGFATAAEKPVEAKGADVATELPEVNVVSEKQQKKAPAKSKSRAEQDKLPQTTESITREKAEENINAMNTEDLIKYMPSITVRKRYIGDTNAPVSTRTTTLSQSARSLIYADGILLSSLLGNNNGNTGSPLWNTVAPSEVERIDMMYGPFSAAYAGNSVGGVLDITTKMPEKFEASANVQATWQDYSYLGHKDTYDAQQYSASAGDRMGAFSWRFNYSHLDSHSQPITFATATQSTAAPAAGARVVTGAVPDRGVYNQDIVVLGATNINHTIQDNFKWKFAYDITPSIKASYTLGLWMNDANAKSDSFLRDAAGNSVYSGNVNIGGKGYTIAPTAMAGNIVDQMRWSHGMALRSDTGGLFDWSLTGSLVDYSRDLTRSPVTAQNNGLSSPSGVGLINSLTGTGWHNVDAKGIWRPKTSWADHEFSLGYHHDLYELSNSIYNTNDWQSGGQGTISSASYGKTQTNAVWLQDILAFNPQWQLTVGGRLENWNAYDGMNLAGAATVRQSQLSALKFSPKASLKWSPDNNWQMTASIGRAYRFPTVTELYQTTGAISGVTATISNPKLKPEDSLSSELAAQYSTDGGKLRVSFFQERTNNLIAGQTIQSPGVFNGAAYQYLNTTQNIGQVNTYGIEISGEKQEIGRYLGIDGLDFSANGTWVDSRITKDGNNGYIVSGNANYTSAGTCPGIWSTTAKNCQVNVIGKRQPRLPEFRANATLTYHPIKPLSLSTSVRYSSQQHGQIDNSDSNQYTYTGITSYLVADVRFRYEITKQLALSGGIDNVNNEKYILFHPFPGRTYSAELKFNY